MAGDVGRDSGKAQVWRAQMYLPWTFIIAQYSKLSQINLQNNIIYVKSNTKIDFG